jgi:hypothetical protein
VGSDGCVLLVTASENGFIEDPLISQVNMQGKKMKSRVLGMSKKRMIMIKMNEMQITRRLIINHHNDNDTYMN